MNVQRACRSLDIRRSCDRFGGDKRRSCELARSTRRYDEAWGAAERADTRLKCSDGVIHHVHSQVLSLWSSVLRNMIVLIPGPQLLESTQGLAYVLNVEENSTVWGAVLDMMYPILRPAKPGPPTEPVLHRSHDWALLEQGLLLADKYDMPVVTQALLQHTLFSPAAAPYSLDPNQPSFALRWLALADQLQLPELGQSILAHVQANLAQLAAQPGALDGLLEYAHEHLSKQQLLQLLQASMQHAASNQQQQQQQQQEQVPLMFVMPSQPSPGSSWPQQQQQQLQQQQGQLHHAASSGAPWSSAANQAFMAAAAAASAAAAAFSRGAAGPARSASGIHGLASVDECSSSSDDCSKAEEQQQRQRVDMCKASSLFAPVMLPSSSQPPQLQQQQQQQHVSAGNRGPADAGQQQQQQQHAIALPVAPPTAPSFGYGVNAGNTSIEDWMKRSFPTHSEGMCG